MLWHTLVQKGWLETRWRLLVALGVVGACLALPVSHGVKAAPGVKILLGNFGWIEAAAAILFAGAGIMTQPVFQAAKGVHGSMHFTLALPVSRLRLLAIRAGLGWLEMAAVISAMCCGMWIVFPALRAAATAAEMFEYAVAFIACASALYSITVFLASFLDDLWRHLGGAIALGALWWLLNSLPVPASANVFRAMVEGSPLIAHTMPWTAMGLSLGVAAILFFAALKVVQSREY